MEISLEKLYVDLWPQKVKDEGFVFNSFLGVLCPKKYFLFILIITLVALLFSVHVVNKLVNNFIIFHSCEVYQAFSKSELYTDAVQFKGQSTVEILSPV